MAALYVEALKRQMELAEAQKSDWTVTHELAMGIHDSLMMASLEIAEHGAMVTELLVSICILDVFKFEINK